MDQVRPGHRDTQSTGSVDQIHPGHPDPPKKISQCGHLHIVAYFELLSIQILLNAFLRIKSNKRDGG